MASFSYEKARELLENSFDEAEDLFFKERAPTVDPGLVPSLDEVFESNTQAYREVLVGCALVRMLDKTKDVHLPYVSQGDDAFNGRTLDEQVVNPFLQGKSIPSTKGPYLSVFRRQARFDRSDREGRRDKSGFDALVELVDFLDATEDNETLTEFLTHILYRFVQLREAANIPITRIQRISLEQFDELTDALMSSQSGGLYPMLLVICMFQTIIDRFDLSWRLEWQGVNVADAASGAGGDVTIFNNGETVLAIEITQRRVDRARVASTFTSKIAPGGIEDYLFLVGATEPTEEAKEQARRYFAQGHEVNFATIRQWILMLLATLGKPGRDRFLQLLLEHLDDQATPQAVKAIWNDSIGDLFGD